MHGAPNRAIAGHNAALAKLHHQRPQGEIGLLGQAGQQPRTLAFQRPRPVSADPMGGRAAGGAEPLRPLHHAGDTDLECRRNRTAALTSHHRRNNTLAKV
jgi:hypothetical protein